MGCHFFLQGVFPTQESNPGLLHCRQILSQLSYKGSPTGKSLNLLWVCFQKLCILSRGIKPSSIPGSGRSTGEGIGYPLQYSGLENFMNYTVHGVTKSQTWLNNFHFTLSINNVVIVSAEQQRDSTIHTQVSILPQTPLPLRLPHDIKQSALCYIVGPYWLPILNTAVCTCPSPIVLMQPLFLFIVPYLFCPFLNLHGTFWVDSYSIYACVLLLSLHILCLRFCMEMHAFSSLPFSKCWAIFHCISKIRF